MEPNEQAENLAVIDIQATYIDSPATDTIEDSTEDWLTAAHLQRLLKLNKSALQKSISKLTGIYGIDIKALRRGSARATEYSPLALKACKLLKAQKLTELRKLLETAPTAPAPSQGSALTITEYTPALDQRISQLGQNAASTSASLNQSVMQILQQIATENEAAQQRDSDLKQARINAAQNRGAAQALEIYQAEQKALNEVLAQLRAMQLGGAE